MKIHSENETMFLNSKRKRQDILLDLDTCSETDNVARKPSRVRIRSSQKSKKAKKQKREMLDPNFNLDEKYFYQSLTDQEWKAINDDITSYLIGEEVNLNEVFSNPKLMKGNSKLVMKL
jgi:hypothetical protein